MNHAEDEALRQRLADENLARASRVDPPRPRFPPMPERDSNPLPVTREPRELPKPEPLWMARPTPTHDAFEQLQRRRWFRWGTAIAAVLIGALFAWAVSQ